MSVEHKTESTWRCDFCLREKHEIYSDKKIPQGWQHVAIPGMGETFGYYRSEGPLGPPREFDLCLRCWRIYHDEMKHIAAVVSDFWYCRVRAIAQNKAVPTIKIPWFQADKTYLKQLAQKTAKQLVNEGPEPREESP